jgi:L-lactate dehydrogenase complex protein LldG
MSAARELMLSSVREAIADATAVPAVNRDYRRSGELGRAARTELFCRRVADYRAEVHRVRPQALPASIAAALTRHSARRVGIPSALERKWIPRGDVEFVADEQLGIETLDQLDGVLTGCAAAVAETGTIVLAAGPHEGRRALSLVPDLHVCVVGEEQIVETVPEAVDLFGELVRSTGVPITLVSGPSATSDIELNRVEGVHGPRTLVVLVVERSSVD